MAEPLFVSTGTDQRMKQDGVPGAVEFDLPRERAVGHPKLTYRSGLALICYKNNS
ncbi:hypothetical protein [Acidovorax sp. NCPPB 3576]|uniref:hypothetical protein n=1 Tax=Acidovorax sp. NCPPB 3576 TaxID=2940488 RepID=UPI00234A1A8D|nr:hypothetical protein [Acidovorax sp. NCPPB 3576]WCM87118.1 hypothetical protein M5C98_17335 [Acidovorax sp. NCPPB 3576]